MNDNKLDLNILLNKALKIVDEKLSKAPEFQLLKMIKVQLETIQADVNGTHLIDNESIQRINIGLLAVREFETNDPEFAEMLMQISFLFKKYKKKS